MEESIKNEDWLDNLNQQLKEQLRILTEVAQEHTENTRRNIDSMDDVKALLIKQINELRKINGFDPLDL